MRERADKWFIYFFQEQIGWTSFRIIYVTVFQIA